MNIGIMLIEGFFWSLLWIFFIIIAVNRFPWLIAHDYPQDVRQAANIQKPSKADKQKGQIFTLFSMTFLLGLLILFPILHYSGAASYLQILLYTWLISMSWNVVDLVIVDWLLICTLSWKYLIFKGTETCAGNRDYKFHFIGFIKGIVVMSIFSLLMAGVSYALIQWLK